MPGHTAAHERASNRKTTTGSYSRSRNQGGVKTTSKSNNNRTRIQNEKQKEFKKTYQANEFSGTGKNVDTSKFRDQRYEQFFNAAEIPKLPGVTRMLTPLFEKGAKQNRKFFADPNYKTPILKMDKPSVLEAGKYKPLTVVTSLDNRKSKALTKSKFESMSASQKDKSYKDYMKLRSEGKIDAYGNTHPDFRREFIVHTNKDGTKEYRETFLKSGNDNVKNDAQIAARRNVVTSKNVGGKTILTTEGKVADDQQVQTEYDARKTKKRGRRRTIFQQGTSKDFTLSKPILLGV
jgi:hypothetical protein